MINETLIEDFKGYHIVEDDRGVISVYDSVHDTYFVVALDDSKKGSARGFNEALNTTEQARNYINWITKQ